MATPTTLPASFTSGQVLTASQMNNLRGAFRILQIVSTTKTDTFTTSSTTMTDITGLSVTITPSSTSSLVYVIANINGAGTAGATSAFFRLVRGSTAIAVGTSTGSRIASSAASGDGNIYGSAVVNFLDSPATTSATTYKMQGQVQGGASSNIFVNRHQTDSDTTAFARSVSSITVMEISA